MRRKLGRRFGTALLALAYVLTMTGGLAAVAPGAAAASGTSATVVLGGSAAAQAGALVTNQSHVLGSGAWMMDHNAAKMELYIDPSATPLGAFTIGDIQSISYETRNAGNNPSNVDYSLYLYTAPESGNPSGATWYGYRLTAEPYLAQDRVAPANTWNTWSTAPGTNQLTFYDSNHGPAGTYTDPTLQQIQGSSAVDWASYGGGGQVTPIDYAPQTVKYISIQTGSAWTPDFSGLLDDLTVTLKDGTSVTFDFEPSSQVWVNPSYAAGGSDGGHTYGVDAFSTVQAAVDAVAAGGTVSVGAGAYTGQVAIGTSLTLIGAGAGSTILAPPAGASQTVTGLNNGQAVVYGIAVEPGADVNISDLTLNGESAANGVNGCGRDVAGIAYEDASGTVSGVDLTGWTPETGVGCGSGHGIRVETGSSGSAAVTVASSTVAGYGKSGVWAAGAGASLTATDDTVTGAPTGQLATNGIEVDFGAAGTLVDDTVTGNDFTNGGALSGDHDPQSDYGAGVLAYGAGSVSVSGSTLTNDQIGVETVATDATVSGNTITETGGGIPNSIGVYAVPCDQYCGDVGVATGRAFTVQVNRNEISGIPRSYTSASNPGVFSDGIWVGNNPAQGAVGTTSATVSGNTVSGAYDSIEFGPNVTGSITGNTVSGWQRDGITAGSFALGGGGTSATIQDNIVTGAGPGNSDPWAQNGIEIANGATGTISGNTIGDVIYTGYAATPPGQATEATAVDIFESSNVTVSDNSMTDSQLGVALQSGGFSGTGGFSGSSADWTMTGDSVTGNTISFDGAYASAGPVPGETAGTWGIWPAAYCSGCSVTATIAGNVLDGANAAAGGAPATGIQVGDTGAAGAAGTDSVQMTDNSITGWTTGIADVGTTGGATFAPAASFNDLSGNGTALANTSGVSGLSATDNWWGAAGGPVTVAGAVYAPWLAQLSLAPATSSVGPGQNVTETATLLDSASSAVQGSGLSVAFTPSGTADCTSAGASTVALGAGSGAASYGCQTLQAGTADITGTVLFGGQPSGLTGSAAGTAALPQVTSVTPSFGPTAGGTRVTIAGTGFTGARAVHFGTAAATSLQFSSDASLTAVAPAGAKGTVDVTVTTPNGTSLAAAGDRFTYQAGAAATTQKLTVTSAPESAPITQTVLIVATLTDSSGQPVNGAAVNFAASGGRLYDVVGTTATGGRATALLTDATAETDTVTASTGSLSGTVSVAFTPAPTPMTVTNSVYSLGSLLDVSQSVPLVSSSISDIVSVTPAATTNSNQVQGLALQLTTPSATDASSVAGSVYASVYSTSDSLSVLSRASGIVLSVGAPTTPGTMTFAGPIVNFQTTGLAESEFGDDALTTTNSDIEVTLPYNPSSLSAGQIPQVFWLDTAQSPPVWTDAGVTMLSVGASTITALLPHLSLYTVIGVSASTATSESVAASPSSLATGESSTVTATVLDQNGQPMSGVTVDFSVTGSAARTPVNATTNASGQAAASVSDAQAEAVTVTASVPGIVSGNTATVTFSAPSRSGGGGAPAAPTTTAVPVSAGIGTGGGTLSTADGSFTLTVPAGSIPGSATLTVSESSTAPSGLPAGTTAASAVFTLSGATLSTPQAATIKVDPSALGTLSPQRLSVYAQRSDGTWTFLPTKVDASAGTVEVEVSGAATLVVLAATRQFSDVPASYWARADIDALVAAGIVSGYPDGAFRPNAALTRADLVKMLVRTLGLSPSPAPTTPFSDVAPGSWYAAYVAAAVGAGLVDGTTATTFSPNETVTREQMAVLLARSLRLTGSTTLSFSDASQIDAYASSAVEAAVAAGYLNGFPDGSFQPLATTTRAEAAKVLAMVIAHMAP